MKRENIWIAVATLTVIGGAVLILASCDDRPAQQVAYAPQQAPQMVAVQQPQDHFWENVFLYHMIFGGNQTTVVHQYSRPAYTVPQRSTTVINNTTIVNRPAPVYAAPAPRLAPSYTAPRAASYLGSYSQRPSYSSYSSRSSYSSSRR